MATDQHLTRIEQESGLVFGLKWSLVGFALALCFLAGCSSLFDNGPERYNTVQGARRSPLLNPGGGTPADGQQPQPGVEQKSAPRPLPQPTSMNEDSPAEEVNKPGMQASVTEMPEVPEQKTVQMADAASQQMAESPMSAPRVRPEQQPAVSTYEAKDMDAQPLLQPIDATQPMQQPVANVNAEIGQLNQDYSNSQMQKADVARQQQEENAVAAPAAAPDNRAMGNAEPSSGNPNIAPVAMAPVKSSSLIHASVADAAPVPVAPQQQASQYESAPMSVPQADLSAPPAAMVAAPAVPMATQAPIEQPVASIQPQQPAPMPHVITAPREAPVAVPVAPQSVEVTPAPAVRQVSPALLTPPADYAYGATTGRTYLSDSRYVARRGYRHPQAN